MQNEDRYGHPVRIPSSLIQEADALSEKLTFIPGEKPTRKAVIRHALSLGLEQLRGGVSGGE